MAAHSSDHAVTSERRIGLCRTAASAAVRSDQSRQSIVSPKGQIIMASYT
jgi:hypothetical protein